MGYSFSYTGAAVCAAERSEFPYLFYYRIIKGRCKVWAGWGRDFLPDGGSGQQKRPPEGGLSFGFYAFMIR